MEQLFDNIDHIAIEVADIQGSINWYTTSFSCEVEHRDALSATLKFGNIRLALVLPSQQRRHLAFRRQDAASFGELFEQRDGVRSTFLADPTGNIVEIVAAD